MPELVRLTEEQVADAAVLAQATYERWQTYPGHYANTLASHRKGKLGEMAVEAWALENALDVESWFRDATKERDADVRLNGERFDVKTWDVGTWVDMGRCVRPGQLASLQAKAEGVLWCVVDELHSQVTIAGWSTVDEIAAVPVTFTGPPGRRLANHQVALSALRDVGALARRLRG